MCTLAHGAEVRRFVPRRRPILAYKLVRLMPGLPSYFVAFRPLLSSQYPTAGWQRGYHYEAHRIPTIREHLVGFFAYKTIPPDARLRGPVELLIPVHLWGWVVEHRRGRTRVPSIADAAPEGYRAQYMKIL